MHHLPWQLLVIRWIERPWSMFQVDSILRQQRLIDRDLPPMPR
jgi:hypothetical protein